MRLLIEFALSFLPYKVSLFPHLYQTYSLMPDLTLVAYHRGDSPECPLLRQ